MALRVILAADGMIWAAGRELMDGQEGDPNHHIIRRFDPSGRLLNSSIPRPSHKGLHPVTRSHLVASRDRVGWFSELGSQYLEFTLDGTLVSTFPGPVLTARDQITGVALCDDGGFFTSVNLREGATYKGWRILSLDRTSGAWSVVTRTDQPTAWGALLGCAGNSLVTTSGLPNLVWLSRAQANQD